MNSDFYLLVKYLNIQIALEMSRRVYNFKLNKGQFLVLPAHKLWGILIVTQHAAVGSRARCLYSVFFYWKRGIKVGAADVSHI